MDQIWKPCGCSGCVENISKIEKLEGDLKKKMKSHEIGILKRISELTLLQPTPPNVQPTPHFLIG